MYSLHSANCTAFFHSSVSAKITHLLKEKAGQKPEVTTTHSAQLLSMVTELNTSRLYGGKVVHPAMRATAMTAIVKAADLARDCPRRTVLRYFVSCQDGAPGPV